MNMVPDHGTPPVVVIVPLTVNLLAIKGPLPSGSNPTTRVAGPSIEAVITNPEPGPLGVGVGVGVGVGPTGVGVGVGYGV
jgi:hypothetical protein